MCGHCRGRTGGEGQMDLILWILIGVIAAVLSARAAAVRDGFLHAAINGLLGLAALLIVNISSQYTGVNLGFNLFKGVVVGVLGVPGVVLLLLVQWVLT